MKKLTTRIFSMLAIAATIATVSCKDEFTEEDALAAQQQIDLAIYVFNHSETNRPPVVGATVTLSQGGEAREVTTNESGVALFPDAKIGGYVYKIEAAEFTSLAGSNTFNPSNFRQGQETEEYGIYALNDENLATVKGRVAIETDLTNAVTEYASEIELYAEVDLQHGKQTFAVTTDAEGRYEVKLPADHNYSTNVRLRFPDLELDQTLVYSIAGDDSKNFPEVFPEVKTYPTLFTMSTGGTQNNGVPTSVNPVYAIAQNAPAGQESAVIDNVIVNSAGEVVGVSFQSGGDYSGDTDDKVTITFTSLFGGSGAKLVLDVSTHSSLSSAYFAGAIDTFEEGSGYPDYDVNRNGFESPSINNSARAAYFEIYPSTTTIYNADYGTGIYREEQLY